MMIAHNSRARKEGKERGTMEEFGRSRRGMLTTGEWCNSVEWGLGTRGLKMVAAFRASIPVEVT